MKLVCWQSVSVACDLAFYSRNTPREEARGVRENGQPETDHNPEVTSPKGLVVSNTGPGTQDLRKCVPFGEGN